MLNAGTTGDLYTDADNPNSTIGAPPSAPAPVPPPVQPVVQTQTVAVKHRMADETPDGKVRDTSTEALLPKNDLGFRNLDDERKPEPTPPPAETKPQEAPPTPPPTPAAPEKVYAGKFKTPEELEKSYQELERKLTQTSQERAELARKASEVPPPPPPQKTPQQLAAEEAAKTAFLAKFVENPEGVINEYQQKAIHQTQIALTVQQVKNEWAKNNPDIAEYEGHVALEMGLLTQSEPELAKDPAALLSKATDKFRQLTGKFRAEGAKEALTQETRVIPLLSNTAPAAATEQPSPKAPLNSDDAFNMHIRMLKEQEQKSHRGLRR